jgi:hypothetical protein
VEHQRSARPLEQGESHGNTLWKNGFAKAANCNDLRHGRKTILFYWSMGAEIETWGGNFISASIESIYIDTFLAQTCFVVKRDSDLTHILIEAGGK